MLVSKYTSTITKSVFLNKREYANIKERFSIKNPSLSETNKDTNYVLDSENIHYSIVSNELAYVKINLNRRWQRELVELQLLEDL